MELGPYEQSGIDAYTHTQFNSLFDSQYVKINVKSGFSDFPSGTYYVNFYDLGVRSRWSCKTV
ncbi:hypothetical protein [Clostridium perfringens]|uniref:Uncharacterized protein n=1 Tax=Clostridium perfringens TaxID=1502 RepID=X5I2Z6_CLOPF|nr:hypothetical protein [Clostridium perfringens]EHK2364646.1 hypothetical protein [Clostridium perfringens]EJT5928899.1 hypothetical protein [Clostridium perfringens]EJT6172313.1 hypothetical protein [Clostridium perfringens]EJT6342324.1 hypothetical protein [Clostridium perfringens]EJT6483481.1 hypothetical protein [Clostridium perfringens]